MTISFEQIVHAHAIIVQKFILPEAYEQIALENQHFAAGTINSTIISEVKPWRALFQEYHLGLHALHEHALGKDAQTKSVLELSRKKMEILLTKFAEAFKDLAERAKETATVDNWLHGSLPTKMAMVDTMVDFGVV
jgi:hypothetical protein